QAVKAWFKTIDLPKASVVRERTSPQFRDAARLAYFGGWFEIMWHGMAAGPSYAYDINSAYPKIMSQLPCLLHGSYSAAPEMIEGYRPGTLPHPRTTLIH